MIKRKEELRRHLNKKIHGSIIAIIVVCALALSAVVFSLAPPQETPKELDFTVSGKNDCLRFLNSTVSTVYVPISTGADEKWQLIVSATKIPGAANGWTDVYVYKGYWDKGNNHTCISEDLYPILKDIESVGAQVRGGAPYSATFGGSTPQSYTVFFIFPPGGQSTFHVTLKKV